MLSVSEAAKELNISATRVRKMIADGVLLADKVGNAWAIPESEVTNRLLEARKAGRPKEGLNSSNKRRQCINLHDVYVELKNKDFARPDAQTIAMMKDKDEVGFMLCICDYFLNLKQREEIEAGVY